MRDRAGKFVPRASALTTPGTLFPNSGKFVPGALGI
jgi:hypothetical protein